MKNDSNKFYFITTQEIQDLHGGPLRMSYSTARRNIRKVLKKLEITSRIDCTFEEYCNHFNFPLNEILASVKKKKES